MQGVMWELIFIILDICFGEYNYSAMIPGRYIL